MIQGERYSVIQGDAGRVIQCDTGRGGKSTNFDFGVVVVHNWQLIFVHTPEPAGSSFAQLASFGILSVYYKQSLDL